MTLLYGKDSNGNQVPLLVDGSGVVQTSGGIAWPGTSSELTAGDGSAVTVGSGLTLAANTLTASGGGGVTTAFDCDFTLLANQSLTTATPLTDQSGRSLTFTPTFAGTASAAVVNGSGLGLTTASNGGRSRIFTPFSGFSRSPWFGKGWRVSMRWANYTPFGSTAGLYTGCYIEPSAGASLNYAENWRQNTVNVYSNNFPDGIYGFNFPTANVTYNVFVLEQSFGMLTSYYGFSASGFPSLNSMYALASGRSRALTTAAWQNVSTTNYGFEFQFANLADSTSRTMYCTNLKVETWD
jgi:hypothetical protein